MKKLVMIFCACCWLLISNSCAMATTVVFRADGPNSVKTPYSPAEAYKYILIQNYTPFWVLIQFGEGFILEPGAQLIIKRTQPLGNWLSPLFGPFYFWVYAYRGYDGKVLYDFVGRQQYEGALNGYTIPYGDGRGYGCIIEMTYIPVGYGPDQLIGGFMGAPWRAEHRRR